MTKQEKSISGHWTPFAATFKEGPFFWRKGAELHQDQKKRKKNLRIKVLKRGRLSNGKLQKQYFDGKLGPWRKNLNWKDFTVSMSRGPIERIIHFEVGVIQTKAKKAASADLKFKNPKGPSSQSRHLTLTLKKNLQGMIQDISTQFWILLLPRLGTIITL